jgi:hypothetical protein
MIIFWMDSELNSLALRMMILDELKEDMQSSFPISLPLIAVIDKEVEDPVVFHTSWFMSGAAGYPYDSSRGKAARTGTSQVLEQMLY